MPPESIADRQYAQVYRVIGRGDIHGFLTNAAEASGGRVLYASGSTRAPVFLGIQGPADERFGVLCYPFRCNPAPIKGRPADEHRLQIRYGGEKSWIAMDHPLGVDIAGVDTTVVLGVHLQLGLFIGLDPLRYDPLPMGISIEFKQADLEQASRSGWHVWERENRPGRRRGQSRVGEGLETLIGFKPDRLLAYVAFERRASGLGLDPPLRFRAAETAGTDFEATPAVAAHRLEGEFDLTSRQILEMIAARRRLTVAVRGGVAEHHLQNHLDSDKAVISADLIELDGQPDFDVSLATGDRVLVECKNVSPRTYADGTPKVEVQKTRSQADPAGRFYLPDQFDVVAACLYAVTGRWEFRFKATAQMNRHDRYPDRLAVLHRVDETWSDSLLGAVQSAN